MDDPGLEFPREAGHLEQGHGSAVLGGDGHIGEIIEGGPVGGASAQHYRYRAVTLAVVGDRRPVEARFQCAPDGHRRQSGAAAALLIDQHIDLQHRVGPVAAYIPGAGYGGEQRLDMSAGTVERIDIGAREPQLQRPGRLLAEEEQFRPAARLGHFGRDERFQPRPNRGHVLETLRIHHAESDVSGGIQRR